MCAIAGILGLEASEETTEKFHRTMHHRGPDGFGTFRDRDTVLLHARLSVIDPEGGAQPMTLELDGETYTLVYNGELYNVPELRRELQQLGHTFRNRSDTEVLLHAYARWGAECVDRFNGIFAFAVWEHRKRRLFLARDPMGVKPLFFACHRGGLIFASEIKTILNYPDFPAILDREGAAQILLLGPGRIPGSGVLKGIRELEPGCRGVWTGGRLDISRYWSLKDGVHEETLEETVEHVRFLVTDAIKRQLVSDVPLGTFLSGGLDSSLISAVAAAEARKQGRRLDTFSVDYRNNRAYFVPGKFQPNSDADYVGIMEEFLNANSHRVVLDAEELADALEDATDARDLPGMGDVDFSLLLFCRRIREHVTVALSGECADEIFGGYPWFRDPEIREREGFPWAQSTSQREVLLTPWVKNGINARDFVMDQYHRSLAACDILPETDSLNRRMKQMMSLNMHWFMQTLLDRKDRMSMACALEVRVPFCDKRIAEYLYRVPWEWKELGGQEKGLLRTAARGILPDQILYRKKSPYPKTFDPKYEKRIFSRLQTVFSDPNAPIWCMVDKPAVEQLFAGEMTWPWYGQLMKKPQTAAYFLALNHWLLQYGIDFCR